jgi:putative aldouronate transport system substrate-binding protein
MAGAEKIDPLGDSLLSGTVAGCVFGDSGKVVNLYESEQFLKYINLMHDWYLKGYLPKDMATSTSAAPELATAGKLFSTVGSYADASGGPDVGKLWQALTGKNIDGKSIGTFYMDTSAVSLSMCVSSTSANPDAAVKLLNIIYTDPFVVNTIMFGIEGEDYVKVSDHVVKFPDGLDANTVPYTAYLCSGVIGSQSLQWAMAPQTEESYNTVLATIAMTKTAERSPYFGFAFDPTNVINEMTAITNVVKQYYPGLESGSLDPAETMPQFVQALKDAGIDKVIAEKQTQLDAWMAAHK